MHFTDLKLARIVQAANRLQQSHRLNKGHARSGDFTRQVGLDDNTLFEEITPVTTLIITRKVPSPGSVLLHRRDPEIWCPDAAWAREYLEHAKGPEVLHVWELSREEPAPKDITLTFCEEWLNMVADWSRDPEDFADSLPEFVREHYGTEALERYASRGKDAV